MIDGSGSWIFYRTGLTDGTYMFDFVPSNGVSTGGTGSVTFMIDTTAPSAPQINVPVSGSITGATVVTISGTGEANAIWSVSSGATVLVTGYVDGNGYWTGSMN